MCWKTLPQLFVLFLFSLSFFVSQAFATAPQITAFPFGDISLNQSFTISSTMSGLSKNSIYKMRIVFAPTGTSNYFGSTWNGSSWYNGTPSPINYSNFLSITTDGTGAWWGDVQGEIDPDDPNFTTGSGTYDLKIGRYTQTGSTATWSNIVSASIVLPPTPTPSPTTIPTDTPVLVTPTARPIATATLKPANTPTLSIPSSIISLSPTDISSFGAVLGTMSADTPTRENRPTFVAAEADHKETIVNPLPLIFILGGFGLLASCGILIALQSEKGKALWKRFF